MYKLNKEQMKELEKHLDTYQQVEKERITFGEVAKNNLVSITHYFKTFAVRYITISSGMPTMAVVHVIKTNNSKEDC